MGLPPEVVRLGRVAGVYGIAVTGKKTTYHSGHLLIVKYALGE